MAQAQRTFRVFISSTFSDLIAERNALQERVFPRLRALAEAHGCRFQAIDLRWGVSEEAALDQQTMKICLGEIVRCQKVSPRPNFLILLGNRYGWRPLPYEIPAEEYDRLFPHIPVPDQTLLTEWYRRDDNAVPAVYVLQPRSGGYVEGEIWYPIETRLHLALEKAAGMANLPEADLVKYQASATEQEIIHGAFEVVNAKEHVFCYARELEGQYQADHARDFIDLEGNLPSIKAGERLRDLKQRLKDTLRGNYKEYFAKWEKNRPSSVHLEQLCEDVYRDLETVMLKEVSSLEQIGPIEREIHAHGDFRDERTRHFVGRKEILKNIESYLTSQSNQPLVVWGGSGLGKSALMAKAADEAITRSPEVVVISRFIGVTPESSNIRSLIKGICHQIVRAYGGDESSIPAGYEELIRNFQDILRFASTDHPMSIFIDALDQLDGSDGIQAFQWVPPELPPHVKLVVSTLPGECFRELKLRLPLENRLELQPMPAVESEQLLDLWMADVGRCLQLGQWQHILEKQKKNGLPLYLHLAFEEVRRWHSYDELPVGRQGKRGLGNDVWGVLEDLFWRLSQDSNHGKILVEHSLGYLAAARNGLSEDEILDVLSADPVVLIDFRRRSPESPESDSLPAVIWSRLRSDLAPYLSEREADNAILLSFYHPTSFGRAVKEKYLADIQKILCHRSLAAYFMGQPLEKKHAGQEIINQRKTSELVFQQRQGEMWDELYATLTSFAFLEARCTVGTVQDMEQDFKEALEGWNDQRTSVIQAFASSIRLNSHHIQAHPEILFTQLYNSLTWIDKAKDGPIHRICEQGRNEWHNWLRAVRESFQRVKTKMLSIEGPGEIIEMAVTPDGERALVSSYDEMVIRVMNLTKGNCEVKLEGHVKEIKTLAVTPDGKKAVSGSDDGTLKVWDLANAKLLRTLNHSSGVTECAITPDGKDLVAASSEDEIKVWEIASGRIRATWKCSDEVSEFALSKIGGQLISWGRQGVHVWDLSNGTLLQSLDGSCSVRSLGLSRNGSRAVYGTYEGEIKEINLRNGNITSLVNMTGVEGFPLTFISDRWAVFEANDHLLYVLDLQDLDAELHQLEGHREKVTSILRQGSDWIITGSKDGTIKEWDPSGSRLLRSVNGPGRFAQIAFTKDVTKIISNSEDGIRIWNLMDGSLAGNLDTPGDYFSKLVTQDGRLALLASEKAIDVWDLESLSLLQKLVVDAGPIHRIVTTFDGSTLVAFRQDDESKVSVWTWKISEPAANYIHEHSLEVKSGRLEVEYFNNLLEITPDGQNICYLTDEGQVIEVWSLPGNCVVQRLSGHKAGCSAIGVSPDGKNLISGSEDGELRIWDFDSGRCIRKMHIPGDEADSLAFSPNGCLILSTTSGGTLSVWDARSGRLLHNLREPAGVRQSNGLVQGCVSSDGRLLAAGTTLDAIRVWNLEALSEIGAHGHDDKVNAVAINLSRQQAISAGEDRNVRIWNLADGQLVTTREDWDGSGGFGISSDEKQIVLTGGGGLVEVWDLESGRRRHSFWGKDIPEDTGCSGITMLPNDRFVVKMWDSDTGIEFLEVFDLEKGCLHEVGIGNVDYTDQVDAYGTQFSLAAAFPDGKRIAHGMDHRINIWNIENKRVQRSWDGMGGRVNEVAVTPDGIWIISVTDEKVIRIWNSADGRLIKASELGVGIHNLHVTPDGTGLIITASDNTCRLMDLETGSCQILFADDAGINSLAISADNHYLVFGDEVGRVLIYEWIH